MNNVWTGHPWCAALVAFAMCGAPATASLIDLTAGEGSSGTINGALFEFDDTRTTGTGVLDPFLRIHSNDTEEGYNTSAATPPFDTKSGQWTHDLLLGDLVTVFLDGVAYYEFILDINEINSVQKSQLSLDSLQIYTSPLGSQSTTSLASLGTLRWDMDAGEDSVVLMDHAVAAGSGTADMRFLLPATTLAGAGANDYLYLYSQFGLTASSDDGFEEWAIVVGDGPPTPTPGTLAMLGVMAVVNRRRRRRTG